MNLEERYGYEDKPKTLIVTVVNFGMLEQCLNWIASLELHGNKKFMVFTYDLESFAILTAFGYGDHVSLFPSVT